MKWYKRDPLAALEGMTELTLEEGGAYNIVIDLLYARDGDLPVDDAFFAKALRCRPQVWRRVRDSLITKGKLHYKTDGKLTANRVETELQSAAKLIANMSHLGEVSAQKRNKNKGDPPTERKAQPQPQPQPDKKEEESKKDHSAANAAPDETTSPKSRSPRGRRLSEDWCPSPTILNWCAEQGASGDFVARALDEFRDYWTALPGSKAVKLDWDKTFKNRMRELLGRKRSNGHGVESDRERRKRESEDALRHLRERVQSRAGRAVGEPVVRFLPRSGTVGQSGGVSGGRDRPVHALSGPGSGEGSESGVGDSVQAQVSAAYQRNS